MHAFLAKDNELFTCKVGNNSITTLKELKLSMFACTHSKSTLMHIKIMFPSSNTCTCTFIHTCTCIYVHVHVLYTCTCTFICMHNCTCTCTCTCTFICMYMLAGVYLFALVFGSFVCSSRDKLPPPYYNQSSHPGTF